MIQAFCQRSKIVGQRLLATLAPAWSLAFGGRGCLFEQGPACVCLWFAQST